MLIGRAPVRISLGGGGTDLAEYYREYGGLVVSATINKYIYGIVTPNSNGPCQVISADYQSVLLAGPGIRRPAGDLKLAEAILDEFEAPHSTNVFLASEVPPGTGLGSSGAVAVNLINIFSTLHAQPMSRREAAEMAYRIEVGRLGAPIGKQDQYASAFGGINCIRFNNEGVSVEPLRLTDETLTQLQENLLLFFTGSSRSAWDILRAQQRDTQERAPIVVDALHQMKRLAADVKQALEAGDLAAFGRLLHESWQFKKRLSRSVSTKLIDHACDAARRCGAAGGKIAGAGGGGFLMLYCEEDAQPEVRKALYRMGLLEMQFAFEFEGARIIMNLGSSMPGKREVGHERAGQLLSPARLRS